jgi:hypothetical protein
MKDNASFLFGFWKTKASSRLSKFSLSFSIANSEIVARLQFLLGFHILALRSQRSANKSRSQGKLKLRSQENCLHLAFFIFNFQRQQNKEARKKKKFKKRSSLERSQLKRMPSFDLQAFFSKHSLVSIFL